MIHDVFGQPVRTTESAFPARLFEMIQHLSDALSQQGIVLLCVRCQQPIQGANHPSDPIYYLDCPCARRTFDRRKQRQSVDLKETLLPMVAS